MDLVLSKTSMGIKFPSAHKLFDKMPERKLFLNFSNLFGGLQSYVKRSRRVVVVFKMV